jgi:hypothetical protein
MAMSAVDGCCISNRHYQEPLRDNPGNTLMRVQESPPYVTVRMLISRILTTPVIVSIQSAFISIDFVRISQILASCTGLW